MNFRQLRQACSGGIVTLVLLATVECTSKSAIQKPTAQFADPGAPFDPTKSFGESTPEAEGMDSLPLLDLSTLIRDRPTPIFSLLISRNGKLVFELYTSSFHRDDAHYVMSVTKSFTATLMGIAISKHLVGSPDESVADALPPWIFAAESDRTRFREVTIKDVLGMSALDASVPPHDKTPEAAQRQKGFFAAENRLRYALTQPLLPAPGKSFLYTDITPMIAVGIISYAAKQTLLEFAEQNLFGPLEFRNYEWMHEDTAGLDNGAYGLRLRPIDMQKFGVLYLNRGMWNGKNIVPADWVDASFAPWIKSKPNATEPNYGFYWWTLPYGPGWVAHAALGWKGQSILVFPDQNLVVTMTGYFEGGEDDNARDRIIEDFIMPSVTHAKGKRLTPDPAVRTELTRVLGELRTGPLRVGPQPESRMIPSATPKEKHHPLTP